MPMNDAVLTVLIAGLLPIVCSGIAKWGAKGYDNQQPREWLAQQEGYRARANAAQHNSFEAFTFFAAGVLLALLSDVEVDDVAQCGWFFIAMRLAYIYCYVTNQATWRSISWALGFAATLRLYVLAL
jgi:uncharacterized MAPEG superfamily protein